MMMMTWLVDVMVMMMMMMMTTDRWLSLAWVSGVDGLWWWHYVWNRTWPVGKCFYVFGWPNCGWEDDEGVRNLLKYIHQNVRAARPALYGTWLDGRENGWQNCRQICTNKTLANIIYARAGQTYDDDDGNGDRPSHVMSYNYIIRPIWVVKAGQLPLTCRHFSRWSNFWWDWYGNWMKALVGDCMSVPQF
jgi:hypothetical protein